MLAARDLAGQAAIRWSVAGRSRWLAVLAMRLSACAVYAGLAAGATAQGWTGMWPLAIAVLALNSVRDTMTACGRPGRPAAAEAGVQPDGVVHRAIEVFLTMPFGGRVLLIAVAAPIWGARASLLGLLDWAIIAVGYGIVSTTAALRRDQARRADRPRRDRDQDRKPRRHVPRGQAGPGGLAVLLQPARPPERSGTLGGRPNGQSIPVLRMQLSAPPPGFGPPSEAELADAQLADAQLADAQLGNTGGGDAGRGGSTSADRPSADGGLADIGFADRGFAGAGDAGAGYPDPDFAAGEFDDSGLLDAELPGTDSAVGSGFATRHGEQPGSGSTGGGRSAAARRARPERERGHPAVLRCRDDGAVSRWFGRLVRGQLMPLPAALLALAAVALLAHLGLRDLPGLLILAPPIVMLVAAPGSSHPHGGRLDWLVPAVLQAAQYIYIAALGFAAGVPAPLTFVLCAAIALRYADRDCDGSPVLLARRADAAPQDRPSGQLPAEQGGWMGWEGRMIICGLGAAMGIALFAYAALAAYVGGLVCWKIMTSGLELGEGDGR